MGRLRQQYTREELLLYDAVWEKHLGDANKATRLLEGLAYRIGHNHVETPITAAKEPTND